MYYFSIEIKGSMKIKMIMVLALGVLFSGSGLKAQTGNTGEGVQFFSGTWDEALAKAKSEKKLIFLDAYAAWCGPCRYMTANVFTAKSVGDMYNPNFINVKIDMEKGEGISLSKKYSVAGYPTLFFIDETGKVVNSHLGGMQIADLIDLGRQMSEF